MGYDECGKPINFVENSVFVCMPFSEKHKKKYKIIEAVCKNLGLESERLDLDCGAYIILESVFNKIKHAEFLIFDLSCDCALCSENEPKKVPNANVMFELGYALGQDNAQYDIIIITNCDLPSNISNLNALFFKEDSKSKKLLMEKLEGLKNSRHKNPKYYTAVKQ